MFQAWLDIDRVSASMAIDLLKPVTMLSWHQVSTLVNNSKNKSEDCNKKLANNQKKQTTQKSLTMWFSKTNKRKCDEENTPLSKKVKE